MYTIKKASVNVQFMTSPPFQMYLLKKRKVQIKWLFHDIKCQYLCGNFLWNKRVLFHLEFWARVCDSKSKELFII